jgi:hypothetical protein
MATITLWTASIPTVRTKSSIYLLLKALAVAMLAKTLGRGATKLSPEL